MAQHLSQQDVLAIATYARIGLTEDELRAMTTDLNNIIETLKPIQAYDLDGVEPTFHPIGGLANVMREDGETTSLSQDEALSNAHATEDGSFRIPAILGGGDA
ncbi:MAG: Asp-tRNA(Asn)/Glu-tRNA(Gln) amidotransferase subunit GatC [Eggerthellaceae bacterium]|nr:Asp-tRNA(Asn)/Glu-tRNA(Gln) amidotransferase subunit GatC [Eggerthellaceae bacterium]